MDAAALQNITNTPIIRLAAELANSPGIRAATQAAAHGQKYMEQLANSPAARLAAELADTWQRFQSQIADRLDEPFQAIQSASKQI